MNKSIRIVLIDDQELVRYGLRRMLEEEENIEVIGDYATAQEAFSQLRALSPDIVLMGTVMPGMNGIEATHTLKRNGLHYDGDVIILADSADYQANALEAGAADYLLKDITHAELAQAIREVYYRKQLPASYEKYVEEAVELIIPSATNAFQLMRFMSQLEERLNADSDYNRVSITQMVGSWEWGAIITILVQPDTLVNLMKRLTNMTEVEKVEEKSTAKGILPSFPKKFGVLSRSSISLSKRFQVLLKKTDTAREELVGALS